MPGLDSVEIIACAMRPAGSLGHLLSLMAFVVLTWLASPLRKHGPTTVR
jgi:hypothetical protein